MLDRFSITMPIGALLAVSACSASQTEPSGVRVKASAEADKSPAKKPTPEPPIIPSPWQPDAEVDPIPQPVEGDTPLPRKVEPAEPVAKKRPPGLG